MRSLLDSYYRRTNVLFISTRQLFSSFETNLQCPPLQSHLKDSVPAITKLLTEPFPTTSALVTALHATGVHPSPLLLETILANSDLSPKPVISLFKWARANPDFTTTPSLLTSIVDVLGKSRSFEAAWSLILNTEQRSVGFATLLALIRRYGRAGMPHAAIRTYEFSRGKVFSEEVENAADVFDLLIDSLCKEGHTGIAAEYVNRRRVDEVGWMPSVRCCNILLNGWFRAWKLREAENVWDEMRRDGVRPNVVSYGTVIEGFCQMRKIDRAIKLIDEMKREGIEPNLITCNPIVDALAEARRFKEALGMVEKFPLYAISPNISTYNSLVKGFCKNGDTMGASAVLKMMIGREIIPTATTYNYFFRSFAKLGKMEEGINLYKKMVRSGYVPDRLTYDLLIKMSCQDGKLDSAMKMIGEMRTNGFDSNLATSTMLIHTLCRVNRWDEACFEFEEMIKKGLVPQYLTYQRLLNNLKRLGMIENARKIASLMRPLFHSKKLPANYKGAEGERAFELRKAIVEKAKAMSDVLKEAKDRKTVTRLKSRTQVAVENANKLIADIRRRANSE